ncbi:MAG: DUF3500 domain-containing protein [Agriterribacter sp.]
MKIVPILIAAATVAGVIILSKGIVPEPVLKTVAAQEKEENIIIKPGNFFSKQYKATSVTDVVTKALAFKSLLTTTQQSTLQNTYTTTLARKWSNLPCGSGCRNGIQLSTLTTTQLTAAKEVVAAALGTASNQGYDLFSQILLADDYLNANGGGSGYGSGIYFIGYLNTPSTTGAWMLQVGGHHMAFTIAFNNGVVVGTTPEMIGVEPTSFTTNSVTYTPMATKHDAMTTLLASLTTAQLTTAKLSGTFSDCLMSPGESNGNTNSFPSTKEGLICSGLTTPQKNLLIAAIEAWTNDADDESASALTDVYTAGINSTYIAYTGNGSAGNASSFLNANTNYVRIDGPRVWIEFVCQSGVVFQSQIHYHSVWRDHVTDYGTDLTSTTLPLRLLDFSVAANGTGRLLTWNTANETNVDRFVIQRSVDGNNYTDINTVKAENGADNSYTVADNDFLAESTIYYRLKMNDLDGTYTYSKIISIKNSAVNTISIFPNPASTSLEIMAGNEIKRGNVRVFDTDGKTVIQKSGLSGKRLSIDISGLPKGVYVIIVSEGVNNIYRSKFVK